MNRLALLFIGLAAGLSVLADGLRPDAFFVGDPGVKLIAAANAIDHPRRPLEVSLPMIGAEPVPHVEPFFSVHGDHAHAVTSALFPLLSAPLLRFVGIRGLYVLPALGFLVAVAGCAAIAITLDPGRRPLLTGIAAVLATPFLFYGLEFWEHTLALGCGALATALFLRNRGFAAGLLFGVAGLLRPEAGWFAASVLVASRLLPSPPTGRSWIAVVVGALCTLAPLQIYNVAHFGTLLAPHMSTNAETLSDGWAATRLALAKLWFLGASSASFWRVAPVVACALLSTAFRPERAGRRFLWTVTAASVLLVLLTAPNDGGGQWGPRYLLFAYLPLTILAADILDRPGSLAGLLRPSRPWHSVGAVIFAVAILLSLWSQRSAYRQLRSAKATYGRIVDFVGRETPPDGYIVTDVWWLDQIAASVTSSRQVLYASEGPVNRDIVQRLSDQVVPIITVLRSASESPDTGNWIGDSCYHEVQRDKISVRNLVAITLRHRCGI